MVPFVTDLHLNSYFNKRTMYLCSIFVSFTMEHSLKIQGGKIQTASPSLCLYECRSNPQSKITAPAQDFSKMRMPTNHLYHSLLEAQQQKS